MPNTRLPSRPAQYFIDEILLPSWQPDKAVGFDVSAMPSDESFCPVATSLDGVGQVHPSLVIQRTNETSGGETGFDFMTERGPGQNRDGQLLATARVEDDPQGYTGDSAVHNAVDADELAATLINEVEDIASIRNPLGGTTEFKTLGSYPGATAPADEDAEPTVRIEQCIILYSWTRAP